MTEIHTAVVDSSGDIASGSSAAIVPWWSFTKTLIAACVLRLAEDGRISLDTPHAAGLPFTPRDLLQHRAGIGDYGGLPEYHAAVGRGDPPWPDAEVFARVAPDRPVFPPRAGWGYSNVGYLLLRRVIEKASGAGLGRALRELVLRPLGLEASRLAETVDDMRTTAFEAGRSYHPGWAFHGVVIGPAAEAALALHRLLCGDLLEPASRAAMLGRHAVGGPVAGRPWLTTGYGLGLMMGSMQRPGMPQRLDVAGHSAGGPGSTGAVYHACVAGTRRTAAVFAAAPHEGLAEDLALRLLIRGRPLP